MGCTRLSHETEAMVVNLHLTRLGKLVLSSFLQCLDAAAQCSSFVLRCVVSGLVLDTSDHFLAMAMHYDTGSSFTESESPTSVWFN